MSDKPTYPVGVSVLITNHQQHNPRLLLAKRYDLGLYCTPGGRIEMAENMFQCAVRETKEETDISIFESDLTNLGCVEHMRYGMHYFMWYLWTPLWAAPGGPQGIKNLEPDKHGPWTWWTQAEVPKECTEPPDILKRVFWLADKHR